METLAVYRYRARKKAFTDACLEHGRDSTQAQKCFVDCDKRWEDLSAYERDVVTDDGAFTLVLIDVDVFAHPGWPVRVWERGRPKKPVSLRDLADWTDWDGAAYCLARSLDILREGDSFINAKPIFWASNPLGEGLDEMLMRLADIGVLQYRTEPDRQFCWNADFEVGEKK